MNETEVLVELNLAKVISIKLKEGENPAVKMNSIIEEMLESEKESLLSSFLVYESYFQKLDQEDKLFSLVKKVIDSLDPYFVHPDSYDEYDGESRRISEKIKEEITMEEIAGIMKEEFNWSFSADFTREDFFWSAKRLYKLINDDLTI